MAQVHPPAKTEAHHADEAQGREQSKEGMVGASSVHLTKIHVFFCLEHRVCLEVPPAINQFNMAIDKNQVEQNLKHLTKGM